MAKYVTAIRTKDEDVLIDYKALANRPNIYEKDETLSAETRTALNLSSVATPDEAFSKINDVLNTKSSSTHSHTLEELGAAAAIHEHSADDITSGILPPERGGTGVGSLEELWIAMGGSAERLVVEKIGVSCTWTAPKATDQEFKVFAVGGGGGGSLSGAGGGGGYIDIKKLTIPEEEVVDVVCGAGGAGGYYGYDSSTEESYEIDGGTGGTTSFGSYMSAAGGGGGSGHTGGSGGAGGGGSYTRFMSTDGYNKYYGGNGGDGYIYGGGGGAGGGYSGGNGGTYGGGGASGGIAGTEVQNNICKPISLIDVIFDVSKIGYTVDKSGGGGYCSSGGSGAPGGGGGFCGNGGSGDSDSTDGYQVAGGGGGGYCSNGGNASVTSVHYAAGGGGGLFADGGDGNGVGGGGGGGLQAGGSGSFDDKSAGAGGDGGVIIVYFKGD